MNVYGLDVSAAPVGVIPVTVGNATCLTADSGSVGVAVTVKFPEPFAYQSVVPETNAVVLEVASASAGIVGAVLSTWTTLVEVYVTALPTLSLTVYR